MIPVYIFSLFIVVEPEYKDHIFLNKYTDNNVQSLFGGCCIYTCLNLNQFNINITFKKCQ